MVYIRSSNDPITLKFGEEKEYNFFFLQIKSKNLIVFLMVKNTRGGSRFIYLALLVVTDP